MIAREDTDDLLSEVKRVVRRYRPIQFLLVVEQQPKTSCVGCSCHCTSQGQAVPKQHCYKVKCAAEHPSTYTLLQVSCILQLANTMTAGKVSKKEQEARGAEPLSLG